MTQGVRGQRSRPAGRRAAGAVKRRPGKRRRAARVQATLPVRLENASGVMRDVSASGIFLETDTRYSVGGRVKVALDLDMPWGRVMFRCDGRIVRVEPHDGRIGVAVRFTESSIEPRPTARKARQRRSEA